MFAPVVFPVTRKRCVMTKIFAVDRNKPQQVYVTYTHPLSSLACVVCVFSYKVSISGYLAHMRYAINGKGVIRVKYLYCFTIEKNY
jgi:hypothetical protein